MRVEQRWMLGLGMGAVLALGACGGNDTSTTDSATSAGTVSAAPMDSASMNAGAGTATAAGGEVDADAIRGMNEGDMMALVSASNAGEIATSKVALEKANHADVKAFARRMVAEHEAMQKEGAQLATANKIELGSPDVATEKTRMGNDMTQKLTAAAAGDAFDRQYIDGQVMAHQRTLAELQAMQAGTQNAALRGMLEKAIPSVQAHLQEAQRLQTQLGTAMAPGATTGTGTGAAAATGTTGGH